MNKFEIAIRKCIEKLLMFFHMDDNPDLVTSVLQFVKFGLVGLSNTILSYGINVLVLKILSPYGLKKDYVIANIIAFLISVAWSFYWNSRFVFPVSEGEKRNPWTALLKTYVSYGFTGIILTNILSWLWIDQFGISKLIAPLINLVISIPLNFMINKIWAFRAK